MSLFSIRGCRTALAALAIVAGLALLSGCGGGSDSASGDEATSGGGEVEAGAAGYPGGDAAGSRHAAGPIERATVGDLEEAWSVPLTAQSTYGAYTATPVIADGIVYSQDLESNVQAIDLESGEVLWEKRYDDQTQGPNGVVVGGGEVFGATGSDAFALDQSSGEELWSVPIATDLSKEGVDMAPGYEDGLVFVSNVPTTLQSQYPGGSVGTLWALDAKTGEKVWHFDTAPKDLWGDPKTNAGGGLWYPPTSDGKGSIYFGTGNPVPFPGSAAKPWGTSRPGENLYTDSVVKLDAKTGKLDWHYQQTPHDIYDWDFQNPPVLAASKGRELAIGSGKSGFVTAVDAKTGKPVWSTPVGKHNGHDDDGLLAMRGEAEKIKKGLVYPGLLGGVIAPIAANETTLFVPVINHPLSVESGSELGEGEELSGEIVALDIASGKEKWAQQNAAPIYGAPTAVNDLVFVTTSDGEIHALDAKSGGEVWNAATPAGINAGIAVSGDTVVVPAGLPTAEGQKPALVAYSLRGGGS